MGSVTQGASHIIFLHSFIRSFIHSPTHSFIPRQPARSPRHAWPCRAWTRVCIHSRPPRAVTLGGDRRLETLGGERESHSGKDASPRGRALSPREHVTDSTEHEGAPPLGLRTMCWLEVIVRSQGGPTPHPWGADQPPVHGWPLPSSPRSKYNPCHTERPLRKYSQSPHPGCTTNAPTSRALFSSYLPPARLQKGEAVTRNATKRLRSSWGVSLNV